MRHPWTLTRKFHLLGAAMLLLALLSIGLTLWVSRQFEGGAAAVNEAGRLRMMTWRLAQALPDGDAPRLQELAGRLDATLQLLQDGDPSRPLALPEAARTRQALAAVERDWGQLRGDWLHAPQTHPPVRSAAQAAAFVGRVDALVDAIEGELAGWTRVLKTLQVVLAGMAIAAALTMLYAAFRFVLHPLERLRRAQAQAEAGDLGARVQIDSDDEFGALGAGFNGMAERLQALYGQLQAQLAERTERQRAESRRLGELYDASAFVAHAETLDELAGGFARQMRRVAGAAGCAVRWSDEATQRYLLAGSDCLPKAMAGAEHCVDAGACLCGMPADAPAAALRSRVIPIRADAPLGHCQDAGYQQIVSVPVRLHERLLGEVDLFFRGGELPGAEDRALLEALAAHLAGAMEGLRAGALEREAAVAAERGLLARELHDSIAQGLAFARIQVQLLRDAQRRGDAAAQHAALDEIDAGLRESVADVRELLLHFRTRTNAEDIVPALQTTLRKFEHQSGLQAELSVSGHGLPLAPDVQVQVLHVLQEALSNVRKHAGASHVWVEVQRQPQWRFEVRDDGRGFDTAEAPDETHVGLRIMRERAARIGAQVELHSVPGQGSCVVLVLPAAPAPVSAEPVTQELAA